MNKGANADNKEYVIGIDIGSSNVTMAVGTRKENGEISVLGIEVQKIEGCVKDGDVTNHIILGDAVYKAKSALENDLGVRFNSAYVGISGRSVYCVHYEDYIDINEKTGCVTDLEMRELNARIDMVTPSAGDEIIGSILLHYTIDDHQVVENPMGAYGRKLSVAYLYIVASRHQKDRVNKALHRAGIRICGLCINPTLLPDLLLTPDEKEEGVAIVDIGGDLTDIAIVREGKLCYFSSLPIGSSSINTDLHDSLNIPKKDIDLIKHRYGSAIASSVQEDAAIAVKMAARQNKKPILQRNIAEIAEERLKDIAQFIMRELKAAKFSTKIPCGIVLTGGATYLANIDKLFARELNMEVRFGEMLNGIDDESQEMICAKPQAVAAGLLLYGAKHQACDTYPSTLRKDVPVTPPVNREYTPPVPPRPTPQPPVPPRPAVHTPVPPKPTVQTPVPPKPTVQTPVTPTPTPQTSTPQTPVQPTPTPQTPVQPKPENQTNTTSGGESVVTPPRRKRERNKPTLRERFRDWLESTFEDDKLI